MQDMFRQIIALVFGGVAVGLILIVAERDVDSDPELLVLSQKTALPVSFMRTIIDGSIKQLDSLLSQDNTSFSEERLEELTTLLLDASRLDFGGSMDTYYIKNESGNEPITLQILGRNFEFAALGGDHDDQFFRGEIDTEIRLLPDEVIYFMLVSNKTVFIRYPNIDMNEQHVFFAVDTRPIAPVPLHEYRPYEVFPESLIKDHPLKFAMMSLFGLMLIIIIIFGLFLSFFTKRKIEFLAWANSAKDIAYSQLVIDYVRDNQTDKFAKVENEIEAIRKKP